MLFFHLPFDILFLNNMFDIEYIVSQNIRFVNQEDI